MADLSNSKYVGTWVFKNMDAFGKLIAIEELVLLELNADGTAVLYSPEKPENEPAHYTWSEIDGGVFLKDADAEKKGKKSPDMKLKDKGDKLTIKVFHIITVNFIKQ